MTSPHQLNFLDANCAVGPYWGAGEEACSVKALLAKMDQLGIAEACPYSRAEYLAQPMTGNRRLVEAVAGEPRLRPVWVVGPSACRELPPPAELAHEMVRAGVRMARLPLGEMTMMKELDLTILESLFDALAERRIPIFIDCLVSADQVKTADLKLLLSAWPGLPVIYSFPKMGPDDRRFFWLWERFERFHVELAGYQGLGAIETVTQRFGAGRLIFGSRFPEFTPLQAMMQVIYSRVAEPVQRAIAGGTLRRLIQEVQA